MLETCRKRPDTSIQPLRKSYQVAVVGVRRFLAIEFMQLGMFSVVCTMTATW
jgi:hypothetical protein